MSSATELQAWLNGIPTGGPNGDGRYPLTYADELTYLVYCPEAQALNPALSEEPIEVFANTAATAAATATAESDEAQQASTNAQTYAANSLASANVSAVNEASTTNALGQCNAAVSAADTYAATANTHKLAAAASATSAENNSISAGGFATSSYNSAVAAAGSAADAAASNAGKAPLESPAFTGIPSAPHFKLPASGALYLNGATYSRSLSFDGTTYNLPGASLKVNNYIVWTGENFDPSLKANLAGATFTGQVDVNSGSIRARGFGVAGDGVIYLGDVATDNYIYKSGSQFYFKAGANVYTLSGATSTIYTTANLTIANYAPLNSPALTGTPTTTTPAAGDNSSKIANTAFVVRDFITKLANYLTGNDANNTPDNYLGSVADAVGNNGPEASWTNIISFGSGGGVTGQYQHQIAASWFNDTLYTRAKNGTTTYGSWKKIWHSGNDGAGSGLDADTVDGIDGNRLVRGVNSTCTDDANDMNSPTRSGFFQSSSGLNGPGVANWHWYIHHEHTSGGYGFQIANLINNSNDFHLRARNVTTWQPWRKIWHDGNLTPANYALLGSGPTFTGTITAPSYAPTGAAGAHMTGNGSGVAANGPWYFNARPIVLSADSLAWVTQSRTFVQAGDPGAYAADGDLWIW